MKKIIFIFLLTSIVLSSCKTTHSILLFKEEVPKNDNDVIIYFYRLHSLLSGAMLVNITLDNELVGKLKMGAYFAIHTTPGNHQVTNLMNLNLKAGQVYVFRFDPDIEVYEVRDKKMLYNVYNAVDLPIDQNLVQRLLGELRFMKYDNGINVVIQ